MKILLSPSLPMTRGFLRFGNVPAQGDQV